MLVPLPEFFQSSGEKNTLLDQLDDFELGGLEDSEVDNKLNVHLDEFAAATLDFVGTENSIEVTSSEPVPDDETSEPVQPALETPPLVRPYHPPNSSMMKSSDLRYINSK